MKDAPKNLEAAELRLGPRAAPAPGRTSLVLSPRLGRMQPGDRQGLSPLWRTRQSYTTTKGRLQLCGWRRRRKRKALWEAGYELHTPAHLPRSPGIRSGENIALQVASQRRLSQTLSQLQPTVKITLSLLLSSNGCLL